MTKEEIRKAVISIMEGKIPVVSSWCTVKAVDWANKTCDVIIDDDEDLLITKILLGFSDQGVVTKPKVNTDVLVMWIDNTKTNGAVVMVQEAEDVNIMGDSFGPIPVVTNIVDRLNALEQDNNNNKQVWENLKMADAAIPITEPGNGAPSAFWTVLKGIISGWSSSPLSETSNSDIEGLAKHGNG